ncbi:UTP--glucose-1-phosphate uridylyltransferase [Jannaschia seohaensis]|uniref:UTP--glucose-1-phosphate uridylyltransferase n=1 Tax=Jannaschia seohaensis TaxID=475081 RepID=A0A2Y9A1A2_9RHOB|nr:UTP--glucose-1-phosphate uridylyltransferase [Jannaschia seohaensis]PWJ21896.1 UTP--glucose-1-phosphate uridylyltransferase [Jannaschia seohaensis]SSA38174.1 UTP--glucose-1-phosphate uridylyltransferase [Jannaschia seohaensis]
MTHRVRTAIFPVAGLGTRFLPATKATPKELLPVIDTPLIQYAIDEARDAGVERLVFVSHPSKSAIERHVMDDAKLRADLRARGKAQLADDLQAAAFCPENDDVVFTMQEEPLGLGHAVLCAREAALPGPVAVVLPDDLILGRGCLGEMVEAYGTGGARHMVATMTVAQEETSKYGILSATGANGPLIQADGMVEKPAPQDAPSREAVVGRYILDESIFDDLARQDPGAGGEIQLTDAISRGIERVGLCGFRFSGQRFDCGSKTGMLRAILHLAAEDAECCAVLEEQGMLTAQADAA